MKARSTRRRPRRRARPSNPFRFSLHETRGSRAARFLFEPRIFWTAHFLDRAYFGPRVFWTARFWTARVLARKQNPPDLRGASGGDIECSSAPLLRARTRAVRVRAQQKRRLADRASFRPRLSWTALILDRARNKKGGLRRLLNVLIELTERAALSPSSCWRLPPRSRTRPSPRPRRARSGHSPSG